MLGIPDSMSQSAPGSEAEHVHTLESSQWPPKDGDFVALIDQGWFDRWKLNSAIDANSEHESKSGTLHQNISNGPLPEINNTPLLQQQAGDTARTELREDLQENVDFTVVCLPTWDFLQKKYKGGPQILRVNHEASNGEEKKVVVDLYVMCLRVHYQGSMASADAEPKYISVEKMETIGDVKAKCCALLNMEEIDVELFNYWHRHKGDSLEMGLSDGELSSQLDVLALTKLCNNQDILILAKAEDDHSQQSKTPILLGCESPVTPVSSASPAKSMSSTECLALPASKPLWLMSTYGSRALDTITPSVGRRLRGLAGLGNLGNTCFMNSAVQCLAHTVPIIQHFVGGRYRAALNRSNVLGRGGKLAEAFGSLMDKLWQGDVQSVSPRAFKAAMTGFAPQFGGYSQQDSQELLAFLLDGLHEDLNRVHHRRFIQDRDYEGQPDEEWAAEALTNYRANNDSIIDDHFQGMYKSTLVCPDCHFKCVKFDKMTSVCLEVARAQDRMCTVMVVVVMADGSGPPVKHAVEVPMDGTVADIYAGLAKLCDIPEAAARQLLLLVKTLNWSITRCLTDDNEAVADVRGSLYRPTELLAIQYPNTNSGPQSKTGKAVHIYHRQKGSYGIRNHIAPPLILWIPAAAADASFASARPRKLAKSCSAYGTPTNAHEVILPSDCAIASAVEDSLRPLKRLRANNGRAIAVSTGIASRQAAAMDTEEREAVALSRADIPSDSLTASHAPVSASAPDKSSDSHDGHLCNGISAGVEAKGGGCNGDSISGGNGKGFMKGVYDLSSSEGSGDKDVARLMSCESIPQHEQLQRPSTPPFASEASLHRTLEQEEEDAHNDKVWDDTSRSNSQPLASTTASAKSTVPFPATTAMEPPTPGRDYGSPTQPEIEPLGYASLSPAKAAGAAAHMRAKSAAAAAAAATTAKSGSDRKSVVPNMAPFDMFPFHPLFPGAQSEQQQELTGTQQHAVKFQSPPGEEGDRAVATAHDGSTLETSPAAVSPASNAGQPGYDNPTAATVAADGVASAAEVCDSSSPLYELKRCSNERGDPQWLDWEMKSVGAVEDVWHVVVEYATNAGDFLDMSVVTKPIEAPSVEAASQRSRELPPPIELTACIQAHLQAEQLQEDNKWYCPRCKTHVAAMKKLDLWDVPEILAVHLKRFCHSRVSHNKIDTLVNFPVSGLDLSNHMLRGQTVAPIYDLYAVTNHYGGLGGGHYTAYSRLPSDDSRWYCFDDTSASPTSDDNIVSPAAYLLFYRRRHEAVADPDSEVITRLPAPESPMGGNNDSMDEVEDTALRPLTLQANEALCDTSDGWHQDDSPPADITVAMDEDDIASGANNRMYTADMGLPAVNSPPINDTEWEDLANSSVLGQIGEKSGAAQWPVSHIKGPQKTSSGSMDADRGTSSEDDAYQPSNDW